MTLNSYVWDTTTKSWVDARLTSNVFLPSGLISPYAGIVQPSGWLFCDGSNVSRQSYPGIFSSLSISTTTATTTGGSTTVSGLSGITSSMVGWGIAGTNIPSAATISSVTNSTTVVISGAAFGTANGTANISISPYKFTGAGNTTTFLLPDLRGRTAFGKDNMGGTTMSRVTSSSGITGTTLGATGGSEFTQLHTHGVKTVGGHDDNNGINGQGSSGQIVQEGDIPRIDYYSYGTNYGSGSSQNMPPAIILNYIIKI